MRTNVEVMEPAPTSNASSKRAILGYLAMLAVGIGAFLILRSEGAG